MIRKMKTRLATPLCILSALLFMPLSASANLNLQKFTEKVTIKGDLRVRYENKEKDISGEDPTDRMRQRFRLGFQFDTNENWSIAAGLATGGSDATSTNDTYSDGAFFETGDLRLDYAYATHKMDNITLIAGQQKNPFKTTWALWDGDVRPAGFTGMIDLNPAFVTVGWYDVLYSDHDMAQMAAVQAGAKLDMATIAVAYYHYQDQPLEMVKEVIAPEYGIDPTAMDEDYGYQIIDVYCEADLKMDMVKITPYFQAFMNLGAEGEDGQGLFGGDPEDENLGYLLGATVKIDKVKVDVAYARIGEDACNPLLKDSDFGEALDHVDVQGVKAGISYKITDHCSAGFTAYLYEAIERDTDQEPKTYHVDLKYKF